MSRRVAGPQTVVVAVRNLEILRSNYDIPFTSGLTAAILIVVGVGQKLLVLETS